MRYDKPIVQKLFITFFPSKSAIAKNLKILDANVSFSDLFCFCPPPPPHVHLHPPLTHVIAYCLDFIQLHIQLCTNGIYNLIGQRSFEIKTYTVIELCL